MAHTRKSMPDSGPGFEGKHLKTFCGIASLLESGNMKAREDLVDGADNDHAGLGRDALHARDHVPRLEREGVGLAHTPQVDDSVVAVQSRVLQTGQANVITSQA